MAVFCAEVVSSTDRGRPPLDRDLVGRLHEAGLADIEHTHSVRLFFLEGDLSRRDAERIAAELLTDAVSESAVVRSQADPHRPQAGAVEFEVHPRPGVMDPVAESTLAELRAAGFSVHSVRTGRRYVVVTGVSEAVVLATARRVLTNDCIEEVVLGTAGVRPAPRPPVFHFELRRAPIRELDDSGLEDLSRTGHLFLSLEEMRAIRAHFRTLERDPTDLELETLAQTWSEHCVHKTLRSAIVYRGAALPAGDSQEGEAGVELHYDNLLADTIARATRELLAERRGPQCLSVFKDNAGVIAFDDRFGIAFKVETHNHPSAIEPYGGAATGVGGCIRDVIGCGLGAKPIANTDVFCVAPSDWPLDGLPKGVLHPRRVLRGIVKGVGDYGNRMGIPTVNGAIYFDLRYLGNPLVYCGCVGLIPRDKVEKAARPGDLVMLIGGRTGRDGIHGATFSSAELTDTHADEFSHAVQIGNAITEKRILDAVLLARDHHTGCLYSAITDCGAGGLSSAVGEMGEHVGAAVDLEKVPLKYAGLRYDEIWISEAQERMVLAVPPANLESFLDIMRAEEVEATVIGRFGTESHEATPGGDSHGATKPRSHEGKERGTATADSGAGSPSPAQEEPRASARAAALSPRLVVRYESHVVGELNMKFLHGGLPRRERVAEWWPPQERDRVAQRHPSRPEADERANPLAALKTQLARPTVAAKEWVIRQYDHEVQGGSVIKPLVGPGQGPSDAAVLRPLLDSPRGIAIGCGLAPQLSDVDPYWMAAAAIDEAVRNVVCVGGDPRQTAMLDNFCWGRSDDPHQLGALVRACQACYDAAKAFGVPFISGKDSLNNEFALDDADVEPLLATLRERAKGVGTDADRLRRILPALEARVRETRRVSIPGTLLISAVSLVSDVGRCITPDLKSPGQRLLLAGGLPQIGFSLPEAAGVHLAVADAIQRRLVVACHDCSDGGWLTAVAEMAIAGNRGARLNPVSSEGLPPQRECCAAYVVETPAPAALRQLFSERGVRLVELGEVGGDEFLSLGERRVSVADLRAAWAT